MFATLLRGPAWLWSWKTRSEGRHPQRGRRRLPSSRPAPVKLAVERLEDRTLLSLDFGWALGLGSTSTDYGRGIATDAGGNVYVSGRFTGTVDFDPGPGTVNLTSVPGNSFGDAFIAAYSPAGSLLWATDLNPNGAGQVTVSGSDVYVLSYGISPDRSLVKLDATSGIVTWRTFLPVVTLGGVAVDPSLSGSVYVTGTTSSGAYVAKLDPATGGVLWSVATGAGANALGITVDGSGNAYLTGNYTGTVDFDPGPGTFNLTATTSAQNGGDIFTGSSTPAARSFGPGAWEATA